MQPETSNEGYSKNILLTVIILTSFISPFLSTAVNIALPDIGKEFSMNAITMSWVTMSILLASAIFMVPFGKAADILGRKKIFQYGNIITTIATIGCVLSTSTAMLIVFRIIQGIGSAMTFGTGMAIVTSAFPPKERGKAIGISVTAVYLGLSVAPFFGGVLTHAFGWRSIFIATIPIGLTVILLTHYTIKTEWAEARNEKFDFIGSIIYIIAMSSFMYGFSKLPDKTAIIITGGGIAGIILFIWLEIKSIFPVLDIHLFRTNKIFAFSNLAALINYAATFAITFILSLYLQYIKGLDPRGAGSILITQPLMMMIFASVSGRMSDKYDPGILSSIGMSIIVIGLILLSLLTVTTTNTFIITSLAILGVGFGIFSSPNTNSIMSSLEKRFLGIASATVSTMRLTGQMMSMGIATMIVHVFIGEADIIPANYPMFMKSVKITFLLFSVLCFLGVFASMARGKHQRAGH